MDLSTPLAGIQQASANFESASSALVQAFNSPVNNGSSASKAGGDSVDLSESVASLLNSKRAFSANIATEIVENDLTKSTFSLLG